ncbi:MAG: STAS domain-containing protein [Ruminococcus sp.]|nr:STAS domain-containing protein [Ruminococcus sp.]
MDIKQKKDGKKLTVIVSGRIDTSTAPDFEAYVKQNLGDCTSLEFDFKEVNYVSSAGLRVLLSMQKKMSKIGDMKLTNVSESVADVFEVTGFDEILTYEKG